MNFSIIIPIYNTSYLCGTIHNILSSDIHKFNFEIIIADDWSDEDYFYSYWSAQKIDQRIKYFYIWDKNWRFRAWEARNIWAKNSNYEVLVFLDQDSFIHKKFFTEISQKYSGWLLTWCMLWYNDQKKDLNYEKIQRFLEAWDIHEENFQDIRESDIVCFEKNFWRVSSTNMIISKRIFEQSWWFDTKMKGWWFEDVELWYRIQKMWVKIVHDTNLNILNLSPNLYSENPKILNIYKIQSAIKNLEYMSKKHDSEDMKQYIEVTLTLFKKLSQKYQNYT